ncbi:MAG: hypothetical protein AAGM67_00280 [Bacteroidota bacterium]
MEIILFGIVFIIAIPFLFMALPVILSAMAVFLSAVMALLEGIALLVSLMPFMILIVFGIALSIGSTVLLSSLLESKMGFVMSVGNEVLVSLVSFGIMAAIQWVFKQYKENKKKN